MPIVKAANEERWNLFYETPNIWSGGVVRGRLCAGGGRKRSQGCPGCIKWLGYPLRAPPFCGHWAIGPVAALGGYVGWVTSSFGLVPKLQWALALPSSLHIISVSRQMFHCIRRKHPAHELFGSVCYNAYTGVVLVIWEKSAFISLLRGAVLAGGYGSWSHKAIRPSLNETGVFADRTRLALGPQKSFSLGRPWLVGWVKSVSPQ